MIKQVFKEAALIVMVSAAVALVVNSFRDQGLSIIGTDGPVSQKNPGNTDPPMTVREISMQRAMALYRAEKALFADARDANAYDRGHIKGALNLPQDEFDRWIDEFLGKTDPGVTIIAYCEGYYCPLAKNLAQMLMMAGFEDVYYLPDGWGNWNRHRMPVESGG
jgi:rhodanese-related sulfurtransferase